MYIKELYSELDKLSIADRYNRIDDILRYSIDPEVITTIHDYLNKQDDNIYLSELDKDDDMIKDIFDKNTYNDSSLSYYKILRKKENNDKEELLGFLVLSIISINKDTKIYIKKYDFKTTEGITSIRILLEQIISDMIEGEIIWS